MSDGDPASRETWQSWMRDRIAEWEPIDKDVLISRCEDQMPPGYAWQRWIVDSKLQDVEPEPTRENVIKAKRALARWLLRQLKRERPSGAWVIEKNGKILTNRRRRSAKVQKHGRTS